jgi:hypothetical protein
VILGAVVLVEDKLDLVLLDTVARILDFDNNAVIGIDLADEYLLILTCIVDRIIYKIINLTNKILMYV